MTKYTLFSLFPGAGEFDLGFDFSKFSTTPSQFGSALAHPQPQIWKAKKVVTRGSGRPEWKRKKLSVISLFSGVGGLDLGLRMAGFTVRLQIDADHDCCQSLRKNKDQYWPESS